jgi:hypothetical protein
MMIIEISNSPWRESGLIRDLFSRSLLLLLICLIVVGSLGRHVGPFETGMRLNRGYETFSLFKILKILTELLVAFESHLRVLI